MKYEQIQPPDFLKDYVRYFWTLESNGVDTLPKSLGPLADGCPGIIFQRSEQGIFFDQNNKQLPEMFLYGQTIKRTAIYLTGKFKTTGVCFHPNSLKYIFKFNADELMDSCLDVKAISTKLSEQLLHVLSPPDQFKILSTYLFSRIRKNNIPVDVITHYALVKIIESNGMVSLESLQKQFGLSERSFERKFKQFVGISPKSFSSICRFQASLKQLKNSNYTKLSDVAFDNGYVDQSHFIKEFKRFAGCSPYQFQKRSRDDLGGNALLR